MTFRKDLRIGKAILVTGKVVTYVGRPARPVPGLRSGQFPDRDVMELAGNWRVGNRKDNQPRKA